MHSDLEIETELKLVPTRCFFVALLGCLVAAGCTTHRDQLMPAGEFTLKADACHAGGACEVLEQSQLDVDSDKRNATLTLKSGKTIARRLQATPRGEWREDCRSAWTRNHMETLRFEEPLLVTDGSGDVVPFTAICTSCFGGVRMFSGPASESVLYAPNDSKAVTTASE